MRLLRNGSSLHKIRFAGKNDDDEDDLVYVGVNSYWEPLQTTFPDPPAGFEWVLIADTARDGKLPIDEVITTGCYELSARSVIIIIVKKKDSEEILERDAE